MPLNEAQDTLYQSLSDATSRRRRNTNPFQLATTAAARKFTNLPADLQNSATKATCLDSVLKARRMDVGQYWAWMFQQAKLLLRTFDFEEVCTNLHLEPEYVAEHLVFSGKAACTNVRLNGLASHKGDITLYIDGLIPAAYRKLFMQGSTEPASDADELKDE